jgi:hypothetical protein
MRAMLVYHYKYLMTFEDASLAEALGLREAMAMVDRLQLDRVVFQMDAKVIVVAIQQRRFPTGNWHRLHINADYG